MKNFLKSNSLRTFITLLPYLWPASRKDLRFRVVISITLLVAAKICTLYVPILLGTLVDALSDTNAETFWLGLPISLILAYGCARLLSIALSQFRDGVFAKVAQSAMRSLTRQTFRHLHTLSIRFHLSRETGSLTRFIDRGTKSIQFLLNFVLFNIIPTVIEVLLVGGILWSLFGYLYALITLVTVALYILTTFVITSWRTKIRRMMNDADNEVSTKTIDSLINVENVRSFNNEEHEVSRLDSALAKYEDAAVRTRVSLSLLNISQTAIITVGITIMLILAATDINKGVMSVGDFVIVNAYLLQLAIPLNILGDVYREIRQALVDMENLFSLTDRKPEIIDKPDAMSLKAPGGVIEFKNVSFAYEADREILSDISFVAKSGCITAIVGTTGVGKTTLSRLLLRFYDPCSGAILIDDQDIRSVTQSSLRQTIGIVPQDIVMVNDSIYYNILYGNPSSSHQNIVNAIRAANLEDFITSLPKGHETIVGERGLKLSGGEKQRIAMARALLRNPKILFFDEATSSLDNISEREIQKNLTTICKDRTTIIIAHRLSTITEADQILVIDKGRIVGSGTHSTLIKDNLMYNQLWQKQKSNGVKSSHLETS